jgi:hypothetical protein
MARLTAGIGTLLITLGLVAYFLLAEPDASGKASITAMIPAFFGLPLLLLGVVALKDNLRKHAMHATAALALLGVVGAVMRPAMKAGRGESVALNTALSVQLAMAALCLFLLIACVRSFMRARRARRAG